MAAYTRDFELSKKSSSSILARYLEGNFRITEASYEGSKLTVVVRWGTEEEAKGILDDVERFLRDKRHLAETA